MYIYLHTAVSLLFTGAANCFYNLFLHTTTRGVRYQMFDRAKLTSEIETCHSAYGDIRIKKSCGYGVEKEKAEFEDLKAISAGHNYEVSLDQIRDTIVR